MNNKFDLSGRIALITGGAGLLGREHAKALLDNGAKVVLTDISESVLAGQRAALVSIYGEDNVIAYVMDVTSESSIINVLESLKAMGERRASQTKRTARPRAD